MKIPITREEMLDLTDNANIKGSFPVTFGVGSCWIDSDDAGITWALVRLLQLRGPRPTVEPAPATLTASDLDAFAAAVRHREKVDLRSGLLLQARAIRIDGLAALEFLVAEGTSGEAAIAKHAVEAIRAITGKKAS